MKQLTVRSRKCLSFASNEVSRKHDHLLNTGHILLGLLFVEEGLAAMVLRNHGYDQSRIEHIIQQMMQDPPLEPVEGKLPSILADYLKVSIRAWSTEALHLLLTSGRFSKEQSIGTEHLLLALVDNPESMAAKILVALGEPSSLDRIRRAVITLIYPDTGSADYKPCSGTSPDEDSHPEDQPTLQLIRVKNLLRYERFFHDLAELSSSDWSVSFGAEFGRLQKSIAKMRNGEVIPPPQLMSELGGMLLCMDLLAMRLGISLEEAVCYEFNRKSEEIGCPVRL